MKCPFCKPLITSRVLFEQSHIKVIAPNRIIAPGHCLVVIKRHIESITEASEIEIFQMFNTANRIAAILVGEGLSDGANIFTNIGDAGGQTVFHAHTHVIPRRIRDMPDPKQWLSPEFQKLESQASESDIQWTETNIVKKLSLGV